MKEKLGVKDNVSVAMGSPGSGVPLRGFFRIRIGEDGPNGETQVVGDSGWIKNQITNVGWKDCIFSHMHEDISSDAAMINRLALGTGAAPASDATSLAGETVRSSDSTASASASTKLRITAEFASGDHPGGSPNIANAGIFTDTNSGGTLLSGATYSSSNWATNQGVSCTYDYDVS